MKNAKFLGSEININGYTKQAIRIRINKAKDMLNAIKWRILFYSRGSLYVLVNFG